MTTATATISITTLDGIWVGTGTISAEGRIECSAILGDDQDQSDAVYDAIEAAIADGETSGETDGYQWDVTA